jgi:hypothetical protein
MLVQPVEYTGFDQLCTGDTTVIVRTSRLELTRRNVQLALTLLQAMYADVHTGQRSHLHTSSSSADTQPTPRTLHAPADLCVTDMSGRTHRVDNAIKNAQATNHPHRLEVVKDNG